VDKLYRAEAPTGLSQRHLARSDKIRGEEFVDALAKTEGKSFEAIEKEFFEKGFAQPRSSRLRRWLPMSQYQRAPPATYEGPEMKYRFGRALEKKLGIKVFGPPGF
jgi:hypothetical protein